MLTDLTIENFAIIDKLTLNFSSGLTVLTGETGAGKSILIDAISILVGGRSSSEFIRHGTSKAYVEGLFQFDDKNHPALLKVAELGIETEDEQLIFRRTLSANGKSSCYINERLVRASVLKEIGLKVMDIHGQHEHQALMNEDFHLDLLDQYGGEDISCARENYQKTYQKLIKINAKINKIKNLEKDFKQKADLLKFQIEEISKANLKIDEEEVLIEEKTKLNNFEKINAKLQAAYTALAGENAGIDLIGVAMEEINDIATCGEEYKEMSETIANSYYILDDLRHNLRKQLDELDFDDKRLYEIETRLDLINDLKRKYGNSIEEILAFYDNANEEINTYLNSNDRLSELLIEKENLQQLIDKEVTNLSQLRHKSAAILQSEIHRELKDLYMEKAQFQVSFEKEDALTINGSERLEFYISANPGEPLKPLSKTASGGELSRIMLAIKTIFASHQGKISIIFDEIDTGVSGRVAQAIAEKIYRISTGVQVFCISHLPHVASMADSHLFISKEQQETTTKTKVTLLEKSERINEVSRMISGKNVTEHTAKHVKEMFIQAEKTKKSLT